MITFTLVAILGLLLVLVLRKMFQKQSAPALPPAPPQDLTSLTVAQARPGDAVSISGAGDEFADLDLPIDRRTDFSAGQRRWTELSGTYRNRRVYLDVTEERDVELWANLNPKQLTLEDIGLSEDDLAQIDQRQNTADNFEYDGKLWFYRFSREVSPMNGGPGGFYAWQFEEEGGKRRIIIRKAEGEPFTASVVVKVNPTDATVYRGA